jgi:hypothetical protein
MPGQPWFLPSKCAQGALEGIRETTPSAESNTATAVIDTLPLIAISLPDASRFMRRILSPSG